MYKEKRKRQIELAFVEDVSYDRIFERDKGICKICKLPVICDKSEDNNWNGTIDHIVPLSVGEKHSINNCQLAHRLCNSLKNNHLNFGKINWKVKSKENNYWNKKYQKLFGLLI